MCVDQRGDQFTSRNQHLIERAFSYFYLSINLGSWFSIYKCPEWLNTYGPKVAFGVPAAMMALATLVFFLGRRRFAVVPPAGKQWLKDILSPAGLKLIGNLLIVYLFVAMFWSLWDRAMARPGRCRRLLTSWISTWASDWCCCQRRFRRSMAC